MSKTIIAKGTTPPVIKPGMFVKLKKCGNIIEALYMTARNNSQKIRKLSKEEYEIISTGEIKEFNHKESRADDLASVRISLGKLRDYINTNVTKPKNCLWYTATYAEVMTDTTRLYHDMSKFIKRFRYNYGDFEYITVVEPQGRGSWHVHVIIIFNHKAPFVPNDDIAKLWGFGFTKTKALKDCDNVGAYFTAYLTDIELEKGETAPIGFEVSEKDVDGEKKSFIKGGRLPMYPSGINIYRISKGIKSPEISEVTERELQEIVKSYEMTYEKCVTLFFEEEDSKPLDVYTRYYKKKTKTALVDGFR